MRFLLVINQERETFVLLREAVVKGGARGKERGAAVDEPPPLLLLDSRPRSLQCAASDSDGPPRSVPERRRHRRVISLCPDPVLFVESIRRDHLSMYAAAAGGSGPDPTRERTSSFPFRFAQDRDVFFFELSLGLPASSSSFSPESLV